MKTVSAINKGLNRIQNAGFQLPTLTSLVDIVKNVIRGKGTGKEGFIMSFTETKRVFEKKHKGETYTKEMYKNDLEVLNKALVTEFGDQSTLTGVWNYKIDLGKRRLATSTEIYDIKYTDFAFENLSKKELVRMLQEIGETVNENTKGMNNKYASAQSFDNEIEIWLINNGYDISDI